MLLDIPPGEGERGHRSARRRRPRTAKRWARSSTACTRIAALEPSSPGWGPPLTIPHQLGELTSDEITEVTIAVDVLTFAHAASTH